MKKYIELACIGLGLGIMAISTSDILSIGASILEKIWNVDLKAVFLSSFQFRAILLCIGGVIMLVGGLFLKRKKNYE